MCVFGESSAPGSCTLDCRWAEWIGPVSWSMLICWKAPNSLAAHKWEAVRCQFYCPLALFCRWKPYVSVYVDSWMRGHTQSLLIKEGHWCVSVACSVSAEPSKRRVKDDLRLFFFETCLMGCRSQVIPRWGTGEGLWWGGCSSRSWPWWILHIFCVLSSDSTLWMCFINFCLAVWGKYNIDVLEDDFFSCHQFDCE